MAATISLQGGLPEERVLLEGIALRLLEAGTEDEISLRWLDSGIALCTEVMLQGDCEVEYVGTRDEDIAVKVFKGTDPRHLQSFDYMGHAHSMQAENRTVRVRAGGTSYYLGLELLRDLNKERSHQEQRKRANLAHGFYGLTDPEKADFLVVFSSRDTGKNTTWLRHLDMCGPKSWPWVEQAKMISFCTDLSVGLGQHFGNTVELNLGRHRFGLLKPSSRDPEAWFQDLGEVVRLTRYGVLIVNIQAEFFQSRACDRELFHIDEQRRFVYLHYEDRIVTAAEYRRMAEHAAHPVIKASLEGSFSEIVEALRDDVRYATLAVDKHGLSPLALAASNGMPDAAREILHYHADVGGKCYLGVSPLHYAAAHGHAEVAQRLLQARAEVNSKDEHLGYAPLHEAARIGRGTLVELLLESRADPRLKDLKSQTALDLAMLEGHLAVASLLKGPTTSEA